MTLVNRIDVIVTHPSHVDDDLRHSIVKVVFDQQGAIPSGRAAAFYTII